MPEVVKVKINSYLASRVGAKYQASSTAPQTQGTGVAFYCVCVDLQFL